MYCEAFITWLVFEAKGKGFYPVGNGTYEHPYKWVCFNPVQKIYILRELHDWWLTNIINR